MEEIRKVVSKNNIDGLAMIEKRHNSAILKWGELSDSELSFHCGRKSI